MPEKFEGGTLPQEKQKEEVEFGHTSHYSSEPLPELNEVMQNVFGSIQNRKAELLKRVTHYENESGAPDTPYPDDITHGLAYTIIAPDKFAVQFDGGLYHAQVVEVELVGEGENKKVIVKTTLTLSEQASGGTLERTVNEVLEEEGYVVEHGS